MKLNIKLENLVLSKDLYQPNDKIRITMSTLPDEQSYSFNIEATYMDDIDKQFTFEISEKTKKMILLIRRKSSIKKDPIIASTILHLNQVPKSIDDKNNNKIQNILIYEPFPKEFNNQNSLLENRKILGNIDIQFTVLPEPKCENKVNKNKPKYKPNLSITKEEVLITPE